MKSNPKLALIGWLFAACGPGPTVVLGTPRAEDAGDRDGRDADGDDDDMPCAEHAACADAREPLCHPERSVCVECIDDGDCGPGERCEDDGECDD